MPAIVPVPSTAATAFACPWCGAHANQIWIQCRGERIRSDPPVPHLPSADAFEEARRKAKDPEKVRTLTRLDAWAKQMAQGEPFVDPGTASADCDLSNVFASQCFNCRRPALWVHDRLVYPPTRGGSEPHPDLPDSVRADYEEARRIVDLSPRGAAALLRLAVQKLCAELGESGKNIDADIASLVSKGLDPMVQEALDALRVIGNEAVHPGQMDLRDDRETAAHLFDLVNDVTAQTIARRNRAKALYAMLPEEKRVAIEARNRKALEGK
jgi:hypothetical protein